VLLDFRGWDTLLEVAVLLVALLGVWAVSGAEPPAPAAPPDPVLAWTVRGLVPIVVLVSGLLLWTGARAPGGAFQAGVVLGGGGILMEVAGVPRPWARRAGLVRAGLGFGLALFLAAGAAALLAGRSLLEYPAAGAGAILLAIEAALTVSIAVVVDALFDGRPRLGAQREGP
jgi:multisubunit Na+/H+ antiporter MnhB subunit